MSDEKATLHRYLQIAREAIVWKLEGVGEYDVRRPLVPSGTNLLGLVAHLSFVEAGYFGEVFGRPFGEALPWADDDDPNADLWVPADEAREQVVDRYRRVWGFADETIATLALDAPGHVPWWGERGAVTLFDVLVHVATETHRHAGHVDIGRELVDGALGHRREVTSLPEHDAEAWAAHYRRVDAAARRAAGMDA